VSWILPKHEVKPFARNTLAAVIVQLRFHPILKIGERLSDFQEKVRPRFPGYDLTEVQLWEIGPNGPQVRQESAHRFHAVSEPVVVSLSNSSISLEYGAHKDRKVLLGDVSTVLEALVGVYAPISPVRLGLRYVNVVDRERISAELGGQSLSWDTLLQSPFASVPGGLAALDEATNFGAEVTSPCTRGNMTVRYALLREALTKTQQFRLDTDRYIEGGFVVAEVLDLLDRFSSDIFQVFMTAAGPALLDWMATHGGGS
jgi:uncharacterized protein (TIGR04255 family)